VGDKKIAGILIENTIENGYIRQSIAGIGINLNQKKFAGNIPNPISLAQLNGREYDIEESLNTVSDIIEYRYGMLKDNDFQTIDDNYLSALYRYNKPADYFANGKKFNGAIVGVEATGELVIRDDSGNNRRFLHKEVEYLF
jgi:BirA family biotin operon repressor/biotin-[acetyl-CoA-carboxylase] ligase